MAFANSAVSDIIATTIQQRSGKLADNVMNNDAGLYTLREKGNVRPFGGGNVILEEIMYNDASSNTTNSYSGYETINISANSPISAAQFSISQYASSVVISGLEILQNSSKEAIIDLMEGRVKIAEAQLMNRLAADLYGNGTGNGGKNLTGFGAALPVLPTSGTYGGIDRATWSFWQNQYYRAVTDGGAATTAANIQQYMTTVALRCVRGKNMVDTIIADGTYYALYVNSLQAIQRVTDSKMAGAGFSNLMFYGGGTSAKVVLDGGIGSNTYSNDANTLYTGNAPGMWGLNTDFLFFRPHRDRNFVAIGGERQAVNQDAVVKLIGFAGNLTSSGPQFCFRLSA
jgi:hypothetical protein